MQTALNKYQKLESSGVWRASGADQRRDVIVSIGDATLVIYDGADRPLAHWSLPAVVRLNAGTRPALFAPATDAPEELEVADDTMVNAIEKVRKTIERRRPRQGRLRQVLLGGAMAVVVALAVLWLPDALIRHAASVVPQAKRVELGHRLLADIRRVAGRPCETPPARAALNRLYARLLPGGSGRLVVLPGGIADTAHLPGGTILINRALAEDHEAPDVMAGYVLVEALRQAAIDPVEQLLAKAGPMAAIRLLTTGDIADGVLAQHAEALMTDRPTRLSDADMLAGFAAAGVAASPYAYARDISGETTLALIEADPGDGAQVLPDSDWVSLQEVCGE